MVEYFIGVALIATFFAIRGAIRGTKKAYRTRRATWQADHPDANGFESAAAALGNMVGMVRYGPPALVRGWRTGWAEGTKAAQEWAGYEPKPKPNKTRKAKAADPETGTGRPASMPARATAPEPVEATHADPAPAEPIEAPAADNVVPFERRRPADPAAAPPPAAPEPTPAPAAETAPTPTDQQQPAPAEPEPTDDDDQTAPTRGGTPMLIRTAHGGDVHTAEMLANETRTIVEEAVYEVQDSGNDRARAAQFGKGIEQWAADLTRAHAPQEWIDRVQALVDPLRAIQDAADTRVNAAHTSAAIAQSVHGSAAADAAHMGRRAGTWYGQR